MSGLVVALWLAMQIEGAGSCPAAAEVEGKLGPLLPPDFAVGSSDLVILAEGIDGAVSVSLLRPDGRTVDRRRLPPSATCAEQAETVAVTLAVWEAQIHPEISLRLDRLAAPAPERAAREIVRVVKPGGTIGLANWTPDGFIGQLLKTVGKHVPPPAGVASPIQWGTEARLASLFPAARSIQAARKDFVFRYESPGHFVDVFRRFYGPTFKAFGALDPAGQARLVADITDLSSRFNRRGSSFVVPAEYLEVVIAR